MSTSPNHAGRLELIVGCMFAGKTRLLIERLGADRAAGRRVLACKHQLDCRYAEIQLASHDGLRFEARAVANAEELLALASQCDTLGIDEVQFFGDPILSVCERLLSRGGHVIAAGIDHNAWGQPFDPMPALKDHADAVHVLTTPCTQCGAPARYSQRVSEIVDGNMVGGPSDYAPRCAACFTPLPGVPDNVASADRQ